MSIVQVINNENPPVKSKHICYMVRRDGNKVILSELLENCYPHPDAPEDAIIPTYEIWNVDEARDSEEKVGAWLTLVNSENAIRHQQKQRKKLENVDKT